VTTQLTFDSLKLRDFRNIVAIDLTPSKRVNVITGDNGQGKTSLLEALYLVATSKSFRSDKPKEMLRQGAETSVVRAVIGEHGFTREQRAVLTSRTRSVLLDGKKPETLSSYAVKTPVVVFHPGDLTILTGAAAERRTLLDRVALFLDTASADARARYTRAARSRQVALEERGTRAADLEPLERVMAISGAAVSRAREVASARLLAALAPLFATMAAPGLELSAHFVPGGSLDEAELETELARRREADLRRKTATFGPQRDDFSLSLDGRTVRRHASQGQQRILTLALKAAELECVRVARGVHPVLLLDDVSSELDPDRTGAVYEFLHATPSQVFVTTTRPELFVLPGIAPADRADFRIEKGAVAGA